MNSFVVVRMLMLARTGRMLRLSAARLAGVPAAGLAQDHPPPQVAPQLGELLAQRHRLAQVGEDIGDGGSGHGEISLSRGIDVGKNPDLREKSRSHDVIPNEVRDDIV